MSSSSWQQQNEGTVPGSSSSNEGAAASAIANSINSAVVPMAHYPPMEHRFPSSSFAANTAGRTPSEDVAAGSTLAASMATSSSLSTSMPRPMSTMNIIMSTSSSSAIDTPPSFVAAAAAAAAEQHQQQATAEVFKPRVTGSCRIRFCDRHHVATINIAPIIVSSHYSSLSAFGAPPIRKHHHHRHQDSHPTSSTMSPAPTTTNSSSPARKTRGPILLELQRLEIDESSRIIHRTAVTNNKNGELFRLRTVARSRGNPSLGTSISSTCLDVMHPGANDLIPSPCATGLTTGALCIHTFGLNSGSAARGGGGGGGGSSSMNSNDIAMAVTNDDAEDSTSSSFEYSCNIDYFHTPRHHRPATAVAWQLANSNNNKSSSFVAIAWASRSSTSSDSNSATAAPTAGAIHTATGGGSTGLGIGGGGGVPTTTLKQNPRIGGGGVSGVVGAAGSMKTALPSGIGGRVGAGAAMGGQTSDRDYGCFVWDVSQSMGAAGQGGAAGSGLPPLGHKRTSSSSSSSLPPSGGGAAPIAKLAYQTGVASLAWILGDSSSPTLAVGGQLRNVQIYDLRVSGQTASPPITFYAHNFAVHGIQADPHRPHLFATFCSVHKEPVKIWDARRLDSDLCQIKVGSAYSSAGMDEYGSTTSAATGVSAIQWSTFQPGSLSIAVGDTIYDYDTTSSSRPIHKETVYARAPISDFCLYRQEQQEPKIYSSRNDDDDLLSALYPRRTLVVHSDRSIHDLAMHRLAPMDLSRRDGRLVHGLGQRLWVGPTNQGPAAMEKLEISADEDISATMLRRARCLHDSKYSMDTKSNIKILAEDGIAADGSALLRLWSWVERVESLCAESWQDEISWEGWNWPAKSLIEAGAIELLRMDTAGGGAGSHGASTVDKAEFCDALSCTTYHSPGRRAAMTSCGWAGKFDLTNVLGECEGLGEYERSAALAVWHADIGAAVEALQRGAAAIRAKTNSNNVQCAETLELVALCIAGYRGGDLNSSSSSIWRRACANLMQRSDLSVKNQSRVAYMTGMLKFLMSLGSDTGYQEVLFDQSLSLCDRAAFACRFLERDKLQQFLAKCITDCQSSGNIEGVTITGIEKEGMKILQSYVDRYADVQTASLITSRIILPQSWIDERRTSAEWLGAYRGLLNTWQMWQSRAMFDVDRAELLRQVKARQLAAENASGGGRTGRRPYAPPPGRKLSRQQPFDPDVQAAVPAQIDARCNYCSAPLGLRQKDNTEASQWLSKMKPVLSCCAQCRKPLPRCSICMLSLGTLNPYMELTKERSRQPRSASGRQSPDDYLSTMTNLPFAEWPSWCLKCRHVGHTHHLVGWFAKHDVCPVSGCNCRCQFDGILKLNRPALSRPTTSNESSSSRRKDAAETAAILVEESTS